MWITSPLSLKVVGFSVFELTVGTGQADEQTDRGTDWMFRVMRLGGGRIISDRVLF